MPLSNIRLQGRGNQEREVLAKYRNMISCFGFRKDPWKKLKKVAFKRGKRQGVSLKHSQQSGTWWDQEVRVHLIKGE